MTTSSMRIGAMTHLLRGLSLAALLMAGSCAAPSNDANGTFEDADVNNPILVEPSYQAIKVTYYPQGLAPADMANFEAFVSTYRDHGNGSIVISVPAGYSANVATTYFADRINAMGIPRDHIIVTIHDAPQGDMRVELNYISYSASTNVCGTWTQDLSKTAENDTPRNFGCAVQQNIAASVADPRDLLGPRAADDMDVARRTVVIGHYEKGEITQASKNITEQSAEASQVGN
jgi:pilus assembly protein CpaD